MDFAPMRDMMTSRAWNWFDSEGNSGTYYRPGFFPNAPVDALNNCNWCEAEAATYKSEGNLLMARSKEIQAAYWRKRIKKHG